MSVCFFLFLHYGLMSLQKYLSVDTSVGF